MRKPLLTTAIVLSIASFGCAGLGAPQASSLTAHPLSDRGLDRLWVPEDPATGPGIELARSAEENLGSLWESAERSPVPTADPASYARRSGADLWNPASAYR